MFLLGAMIRPHECGGWSAYLLFARLICNCQQGVHDFVYKYLCISNGYSSFILSSPKEILFFHIKKNFIISDIDIAVSLLLVEEPVFKNVKNKHLGMPPF